MPRNLVLPGLGCVLGCLRWLQYVQATKKTGMWNHDRKILRFSCGWSSDPCVGVLFVLIFNIWHRWDFPAAGTKLGFDDEAPEALEEALSSHMLMFSHAPSSKFIWINYYQVILTVLTSELQLLLSFTHSVCISGHPATHGITWPKTPPPPAPVASGKTSWLGREAHNYTHIHIHIYMHIYILYTRII